MLHRHLIGAGFSLAAIDDVIARGKRDDWLELRQAVLGDPTVAEKVRKICEAHLPDPYAQRYYFWMHYVRERTT